MESCCRTHFAFLTLFAQLTPFALCGAAGTHHTLYWNGSNPRLSRGDLSLRVHLDDHLHIICPHYALDVPALRNQRNERYERYALYLVEEKDYGDCVAAHGAQLLWKCDRPTAPHGAERFTERFRRFTAFSLGNEFREGRSYYYVSKPIQQQGKDCLRLNVTVLSRDQASPSPASKQKWGFQADDAAVQVLRSVGHNAAMGGSRPFTLIILLLPLMVLGGL